MKKETRQEIKELIKNVLHSKFSEYNSETEHKPFFGALFSERDIIIGSVIQSLYTTFGMSVYEQMAIILAKDAGFYAERQYTLFGKIDLETENKINLYWKNLKNDLKNKKEGTNSDKNKEIDMINKFIQPYSISEELKEKLNGADSKKIKKIKKESKEIDGDSTVDVFIRKPDGSEFYIDITTVKNNLKGFEVLKLKLLRWVGLRFSMDKNVNINTMIAIPYNPYYPEDYRTSRWNLHILDGENDMLVQEEFWNFVGDSEGTYEELIEIFREVGLELKDEIKEFFENIDENMEKSK